MSMTENAIKEINHQAIAAAKVTGHTEVPTAVIPNDMRVMNLEEFMAAPSRFRGTYNTSSVSDFAAYVNDKSGATCFIDAEQMSAKAYFDLGTQDKPGHGEHKALLTLEQTAGYAAMLGVNSKRNSQRELADWLEDWRTHLTARDAAGEDIDLKAAVAAVRRIKIDASRSVESEDRNMGASRSTLEQVEARADNMPAGFTFTCKPYEDLSLRDFYLQLSILTSDEPKLVLRITALEATKEEIATEFKKLVSDKVDGEIPLYLGSFSK